MSKRSTTSSEEEYQREIAQDFNTIERQAKYRTENGKQAAEYQRSEAEYRRDCMLTREESIAEQTLQESAQIAQFGKAKAQYDATIAAQTVEFRKFNLQKFNNKIQYESGEFTIGEYMVGKLVAFPDDQEIIDLTGSLEEKDEW